MSIVRVGLAETKNFAAGYEAIFGKKKTSASKKPKAVAKKKKNQSLKAENQSPKSETSKKSETRKRK